MWMLFLANWPTPKMTENFDVGELNKSEGKNCRSETNGPF